MRSFIVSLDSDHEISSQVPTTLHTHPLERCDSTRSIVDLPEPRLKWCGIHRPSAHPLRGAGRVLWTTGARPMVLRVCAHNQAHPDPDEAAWMKYRELVDHGDLMPDHKDVCDGCCVPRPEDIRHMTRAVKRLEHQRVAEIAAKEKALHEIREAARIRQEERRRKMQEKLDNGDLGVFDLNNAVWDAKRPTVNWTTFTTSTTASTSPLTTFLTGNWTA